LCCASPITLKYSELKPVPLPHEALHAASGIQAPVQSSGQGSLLLQLGKRYVPLAASHIVPLCCPSTRTTKSSVEKPVPLPHDALQGIVTSHVASQLIGQGSSLVQLRWRSSPLAASHSEPLCWAGIAMLKRSNAKLVPLLHDALHGVASSQVPSQLTGHGWLLLQFTKRSSPSVAVQSVPPCCAGIEIANCSVLKPVPLSHDALQVVVTCHAPWQLIGQGVVLVQLRLRT
jgi:hypothetical protein